MNKFLRYLRDSIHLLCNLLCYLLTVLKGPCLLQSKQYILQNKSSLLYQIIVFIFLYQHLKLTICELYLIDEFEQTIDMKWYVFSINKYI